MSEISCGAASVTESVLREMHDLAAAEDAVNLAQGFPDIACPPTQGGRPTRRTTPRQRSA
jgi:hypothetical protein